MERWGANVERSEGCWRWRGTLRGDGYGVINAGKEGGYKILRAHRVAYEHFVGPIPEELEMRHLCHNRECVNPEHLAVGTRADNMRDMVEAGRWGDHPPMRGAGNGNSKLTDSKVLAIRASGEPGVVLARRFGVSGTTVSQVRRRRTWAHL